MFEPADTRATYLNAAHPDAEVVVTSHEPGILIITLNRPAARNAVNRMVAEQVAAAIDELESREDLAVGIITGSGGTFSAGMDLKAFAAGESAVLEGRGFAGLTESRPQKPLIAAVEGYALAGGCEIVLACDLVVSGRSAKFGIPEVTRGLVAAGGGLLRLPEWIPPAIAKELALTGDMLGAERAHSLGLVNLLTDDGGAVTGALEIATRIAANAPLAVAASKRVIRESRLWPERDRFERQDAMVAHALESEDAQEGAVAFAQKRPPVWQGR